MYPPLASMPLLSATEVAALCEFADHLRRWRDAKSVISDKDADSIWERHILDSLQLVRFAPHARKWLDIGSGAGFPSVVIAIWLKKYADANMLCVESDRRKCAFLSSAASRGQLNMSVFPHRVEEIRDELDVDAVTIRALSSLEALMTMLPRFLDKGATAILPIGKQTFRFSRLPTSYSYEFHPSLIEQGSYVAIVRKRLKDL